MLGVSLKKASGVQNVIIQKVYKWILVNNKKHKMVQLNLQLYGRKANANHSFSQEIVNSNWIFE